MLNEAFLTKPGLFLFSDSDSVSTPEMNAYVINNWAAKGIPVRLGVLMMVLSWLPCLKEAWDGNCSPSDCVLRLECEFVHLNDRYSHIPLSSGWEVDDIKTILTIILIFLA